MKKKIFYGSSKTKQQIVNNILRNLKKIRKVYIKKRKLDNKITISNKTVILDQN